jgi:hypothetical protein
MTRRAVFVGGLLATQLGCTSIDPGSSLVVPPTSLDPDYFYCHVEPQYIFGAAYKCGPGQASDNGSCHFSSAVPGMQLLDHPPINCGGGDHPVDLSALGTGSPAVSNYSAVSLEMSLDYTSAPLYVRPLGNTHPRAIFNSQDNFVQQILATWASKSQ